LEYDFKKFGSAETADDWAQDVFISVWRNLEKFEGSGSNFYSWVSSIAFNEAQDAFTKLYKAQKKMTGLTIPARHNDSVDGDVEDNPEMLSEGGYDGGVIGIPKSVQGTDRNICLLIRDGRSYAGIAEELNMKVSAVKKRLQRLRERLQAEQAA
jgi:RNA polymerase sigma-70 factor (ECF subfamily)